MKPKIKQNNTDPYLQQKILSASPKQLVAYIYDAGISACVQKDKERALRSIQELINSLDFDQGKELTKTFYQMYRFLQTQLRQDKYDEVKNILTEIRKTWIEAHKVY